MHVLIFFSVRVILIWNRLPAALVQESNLFVFKSSSSSASFNSSTYKDKSLTIQMNK